MPLTQQPVDYRLPDPGEFKHVHLIQIYTGVNTMNRCFTETPAQALGNVFCLRG